MDVQSSDQPKNNDSIPENRAWEEFLPVCKAWRSSVGADNDELIFNGFEWAPVEMAIHELSHAALLEIRPHPLVLIETIEMSLADIPRLTQIEQEADAWSIECSVCSLLGIPIDFGDAVAAAEVQGVHKLDMDDSADNPGRWERCVGTVLSELRGWKNSKR